MSGDTVSSPYTGGSFFLNGIVSQVGTSTTDNAGNTTISPPPNLPTNPQSLPLTGTSADTNVGSTATGSGTTTSSGSTGTSVGTSGGTCVDDGSGICSTLGALKDLTSSFGQLQPPNNYVAPPGSTGTDQTNTTSTSGSYLPYIIGGVTIAVLIGIYFLIRRKKK